MESVRILRSDFFFGSQEKDKSAAEIPLITISDDDEEVKPEKIKCKLLSTRM